LVLVEVVAGDGHRLEPLRHLHVKDHLAPVSEGAFTGGEVELPHPAEAFVEALGHLRPNGLEAAEPLGERFGIVQSPDLEIGDHQRGGFDRR